MKRPIRAILSDLADRLHKNRLPNPTLSVNHYPDVASRIKDIADGTSENGLVRLALGCQPDLFEQERDVPDHVLDSIVVNMIISTAFCRHEMVDQFCSRIFLMIVGGTWGDEEAK